jgi:hypothetical protein
MEGMRGRARALKFVAIVFGSDLPLTELAEIEVVLAAGGATESAGG